MKRRLALIMFGTISAAIQVLPAGASVPFPSPFRLRLAGIEARLALFDTNVRFAPYGSKYGLHLTEGRGLGGSATYLLASEGSAGSAPVQLVGSTFLISTGRATTEGDVASEIASLAGSRGLRWFHAEALRVAHTGAGTSATASFGIVTLRFKVTTSAPATMELIAESTLLFG